MDSQTECMTLKVNLPPEVKEWLITKGKKQHRNPADQAAFLCEEYLIRICKPATKSRRNGVAKMAQEVQE